MGLVLHTPHGWLSVGLSDPLGRAAAVVPRPQPRRARLWPFERPCSPACRQSLVGTAARLLAVAVNRCVVSGPRASHTTPVAQCRPYAPCRPGWSSRSTATASACPSVAPRAAMLSRLPTEPRGDGRSRLLAVTVNRCGVRCPRASHATPVAQCRPYAPCRPCWSSGSTATASGCPSVAL